MPTESRLFSDAAAAAMLDDMLDTMDDGAEKAGDVVGPYRLVEKLGEGGFGIVWRAEQTHPMRREAAVKLLKRGMDSRQILARFEQERRMLAAMEHPNIATMLDAGVSADGRPYFVMEMLRGLSLTKYCERNELTLKEKITLFRDVCGGVQHAHQKGVIHRDLKPSNILVTNVDGSPVPKIIDFGIAKALGAGPGGIQAMTLVTQANFVLGTPQYMSPEQIADGSNVDTRSDIYALGALLYEVLAGTPPFDPRTLQEKGAQEFRRMIREQQPKRPSTALSAQTTRQTAAGTTTWAAPDASGLPADLDWITLRALEKEPQRRYQSAAEFAADLQRFLNNEPVLAHPPSTTYVAARWIRRHRAIFSAAIFSVVALVAGTGVALWQASVARTAQARAEAEANRSRETAEFVTSMLMEVADEVHMGRNPEALRLALISSQKRIEAMTQDADLQIALISQVAFLFQEMSDWKLSAEALKKRAEMIAARRGADSAEARSAAFKHLHMVIDQGDRIEGARMLTELSDHIERHEGRGSPDWFEAQRLLVRVRTKLRDGKAAIIVSAAAAEEARRQQLPEHLMHEVLMQHVEALMSAQEFDEAIVRLEKLRATHSAEAHREGIDQKVVEVLVAQRKHAAAADLQLASVERLRKVKGFDPRRFLFHLRWLAGIELQARRHAAAITHLDEATALVKHLSSQTQEGTESALTLRDHQVMLLEIRTNVHKARKQHAEALAAAQEAVAIARKAGNPSLVSRALASLSQAHESAGHLDDAWQIQQEIYALHATHNASYKNRLDDLREMTRLRQKQGRHQEALAHARDAWQQTLAEPSSRLEPDYLGYMGEFALKTWKTQQAADPGATPPAEVSAWEEAVRNDPTKKKQ
ncbi:MAG TPA: serine/threonine-protein kinase [Prosthecobacter sp.]